MAKKAIMVSFVITTRVIVTLDADEQDFVDPAIKAGIEKLLIAPEDYIIADNATDVVEDEECPRGTLITDWEVGDTVLVPEPNETDIHGHSFTGRIKAFGNGLVVVEDSDGECYAVEPERLTDEF